MTFVNPSALVWGLLGIPIVILYLRRVRPPRRSVSTGPFWEQIYAPQETESYWWWLRHLISLCLQLLILGLVVLALAEPHVWPPRRIVLVVDNSASMAATDVIPTRLEQAKKLARRQIGGLAYRDQMAIVSCGDALRVHCGWTGQQDALLGAVEAIPAAKGSTRVNEAVEMARRLLAGKPNGEILVLSDGCFDEVLALFRQDDVDLILVGTAGDNVSVTALAARRSLTDPQRCQVLAEVTSFSPEPVECRIELALNGKTVPALPIRLGAAGRWQQVFEMTTPDGGELTAGLDRPDVFMEDNRASAPVPPSRVHRVVLMTEGNVYLEKVLQANPRVELTVTDVPPAGVAAETIRVFDRQVPGTLPDGPILVVDPAGPCELWDLGELLEEPIVAKQADALPLLANVRLEGVRLHEARRLLLSEKARPLAQPVAWTADGLPVGYAIDRPAGRVLVLTGSLAGSELAARTAFPILMANMLEWLTRSGSEQDDLPEAGQLAAGLRDLRESDVRVPVQPASAEAAPVGPPGLPLWLFLAGAALLLLVVEWCWFQRRWIC